MGGDRKVNSEEFFDYAPPNHEILNAFAKTQQHLAKCDKAHCSISGGADSDIMLDIVSRADDENKVTYGFYNTGIEYDATKRHLEYLRQKYGVEIREYKAKVPVPVACRKHGQPFVSKFVSEMIQRLQRHGFKWEDKPFDELLAEYPKCKAALKWWCNMNGEKSRFNIKYNKLLKEFMIANPPDFAISNKCCDFAKKNVAKDAAKEDDCDLVIMGVRKAEGGIRSAAYKSCFSEADTGKKANFRPLFWLTNADKKEYEEHCEIVHSDCYTVYGLDRTGCAGCPFGKDFEKELAIIKEYEPKLYKAVNNIFGKSYEYTRKYNVFKQEAIE
jgi:3'-phosphoadenosine 5'-phosphosulfate sulfotransferase (PAPS reductase)/FAD synthetase